MTGNTFKTWFAQNGRENEDVSGRLSEEVEFFKQEKCVWTDGWLVRETTQWMERHTVHVSEQATVAVVKVSENNGLQRDTIDESFFTFV